MGVIEIVGGIFLLVCAVIIIVAVTAQEGKSNGLGALAGASDSYLGKNKAKTQQQMLVRVTKVVGTVFVLASLAVYFIIAAIK